MNRIEQINKELKVIKVLEKARSFHDGLDANSLETENAKFSFLDALMDCEVLDSCIVNYKTAMEYKKKLIRERAVLRTQENRVMFQKWLDKPNYKKLMKVLSKYGNNQTEAFNRFINEL